MCFLELIQFFLNMPKQAEDYLEDLPWSNDHTFQAEDMVPQRKILPTIMHAVSG